MSILLLIARLLLAAVFVVAGLAKVADLKGSQQAVKGFGVPTFLATPVGILLPFAELAVAIALIPSSWAFYGAIGALVLLGVFIVGISANLSVGRKPDCHCFGQLHSEPVGASTLIRNVLLGIVAGFVIWQGAAYSNVGPSAVAWISTLSVAQGIELVVGIILLVVVAIETWLLLQTLTQVGKLLTRLELIEENGGAAPGAPVLGLPEDADAPAFELPDLSNNMVSLSNLLEKSVETHYPAVLVFSSPTCGPCNAMIPQLSQWIDDAHGKATIVVVSQGTVEENRAKFAAYPNISTVLLQQDREVAEAYQVRGTPSAVAVRYDGSIFGPLAEGEDEIRDLIFELTAEIVAKQPNPLLEDNHPKNGLAFPESPKKGQPAPDLKLLDINDNLIKLSDFRGTPTLLVFWSPTCTYCEAMLRDLLVWERKPPKGAPQLLVISTSGSKKENMVGFKSTVVLDDSVSSYSAARWFKASGTPMAVLLDEKGVLLSDVVVGADNVMELTKPVRSNMTKLATA